MNDSDFDILGKQIAGLRKLLAYFDYSKAKMAKGLDVNKSVVYAWFGRGRISAHMAIEAEKVTKGEITKQDLRPDVVDWLVDE